MARKKTILAFQEWSKDEDAVDALLQRISEGVKLRDACLEIRMPYTLVFPFLNSNPHLKARFEAARAVVAETLMDDRLEIAKGATSATEPVQVMGAKLACDVMESTAKAWNRERYGEERAPAVSVTLNLGDVVREVRELEARLGISAPVAVLPPAEQAQIVDAEQG